MVRYAARMARKALPAGLVRGADGAARCFWGVGPELEPYHDHEWGVPVLDDARLFEKLCLEGFQSGLSWLVILRKRAAFRAAFRDFAPVRVARFGARDVERLLGDAGIVRHRGKIESTINNARRALEVIAEHGSLARYLWSFEPQPGALPRRMTHAALLARAETEASTALARDLRKRGWSFVGPTTVQAFMQAMGMVNDHLDGCAFRPRIDALRAKLRRPGPRPRPR